MRILIAEDDVASRRDDESGQDYLYPESGFVAIELPHAAAQLFVEAS